jgi:predicted helicase
LGFITNHSYLDNPTFRGMRQSLLNDFDKIYILDLHGNSKKKERSPNGLVDQNVFDIQQGVVISFFVKSQEKKRDIAKVYHADLYGNRTTKYHWLSEKEIKTARWVELKPQSPFYLFVPKNTNLLAEYGKYWKITEIMPVSSVGIVTGQDKEAIAINYEHAKILAQRYDLPESVIKPILYRPFEKRYVIYDKRVVTRPRFEVMQSMLLGDNLGLAIGRAG